MSNKQAAVEAAEAEQHQLVFYRTDEKGFTWKCSCGESDTTLERDYDGTNPCPQA